MYDIIKIHQGGVCVKNYSEIIRGLREDRDLKQSEVATIIKTTQQQYSKYENENAEIPVKALIDLAEYYKVSTDYLLGRVAYSANIKELETFLSNNTAMAKMLSEIQTLSTESQQAVFEYVKLQTLKEKSLSKK